MLDNPVEEASARSFTVDVDIGIASIENDKVQGL